MPCSCIGGKIPKLIVRDVFWNISRYYCANKYHGRHQVLCPPAWGASTIATGLQKHLFHQNKKGKTMSADNLSSYIMECGSSEKFELLLEKCHLVLRRTIFQNICCNIFMKQLGNIRGRINIPPAFMTVYLDGFLPTCLSTSALPFPELFIFY